MPATHAAKDGRKPQGKAPSDRPALEPYRENPPYGILGGTMETSASFEARSAPSSYPTHDSRERVRRGCGCILIYSRNIQTHWRRRRICGVSSSQVPLHPHPSRDLLAQIPRRPLPACGCGPGPQPRARLFFDSPHAGGGEPKSETVSVADPRSPHAGGGEYGRQISPPKVLRPLKSTHNDNPSFKPVHVFKNSFTAAQKKRCVP